MKCMDSVNNAVFNVELIHDLTVLYNYKGKDFYYEEILKNFMKGIISETVERDVKYATKMLELRVTDARLNLIIKKDSKPKTKDEEIVSNLKRVFLLIQEMGTDLILDSNEFLMLGTKVFNDKKFNYASKKQKVQTGLLTEEINEYAREDFEKEITRLKKYLKTSKIEATQIITRFFMDLIKTEYFTEYNTFMAILICYCLLVSQRFNVFKYISFFELYTNKMEDFASAIAKANFGYKEGFSDTSQLNNEIIDLMIEGYKKVEIMAQDTRFNKEIKLNKVNVVESAIMSLDQNFTKNDIKKACPFTSDSTINRALENLKNENKIISNGTGRSATWTKLVNNVDISRRDKQINIFDMIEE